LSGLMVLVLPLVFFMKRIRFGRQEPITGE